MRKMFVFFDYYAHKPTLIFAMALTGLLKTVLDIVNVYLFSDWEFMISLLIITHIDTVLGVWLAVRNQQVSSRGFAGYFHKHIIYALFLIMCHVLTHLKIDGKEVAFFNWVNNMFYIAILVREAISILEKVGAIKPNLIPSWVLAYLKRFDSTGRIQDLNPNSPEQ
jgi:phage-related holin